MADICMCTGNCPINENCYRYMAEPDSYGQTYSSLESICIPNDYEMLIPYENKQNKINYTLEDFILDEIRKSKGLD